MLALFVLLCCCCCCDRFFYASSACIYPEHKQLETEVEGGGLKEGDAWPAQVRDCRQRCCDLVAAALYCMRGQLQVHGLLACLQAKLGDVHAACMCPWRASRIPHCMHAGLVQPTG
jgi:hypothetical protein